MTSLATKSIRSSMDLIMRGLNAADTMRRRRAWRGLSMLIIDPKKSSISAGMSIMEVAPCPDWKISGWRLASEMWAWRGQRVVAGALGDHIGECLGDLGLLEEGHGALAPQRLERSLAFVPGAGPELHVGEVDLVGGEDGARFHVVQR